jgi:hypothetical protein
MQSESGGETLFVYLDESGELPGVDGTPKAFAVGGFCAFGHSAMQELDESWVSWRSSCGLSPDVKAHQWSSQQWQRVPPFRNSESASSAQFGMTGKVPEIISHIQPKKPRKWFPYGKQT